MANKKLNGRRPRRGVLDSLQSRRTFWPRIQAWVLSVKQTGTGMLQIEQRLGKYEKNFILCQHDGSKLVTVPVGTAEPEFTMVRMLFQVLKHLLNIDELPASCVGLSTFFDFLANHKCAVSIVMSFPRTARYTFMVKYYGKRA